MWTGSAGVGPTSGSTGGAGASRCTGLRWVATFFVALRGFLAGRDLRAAEAGLRLAFARPVFLTRFARLVLVARRFAMHSS